MLFLVMVPSVHDPPLRFDCDLRRRIQANLDTFERRAYRGNGLTPAAVALVIVDNEDDQPCFILTRRAKKLRAHSGQWALPGGQVDGNETVEEAGLRELSEEVGLDLPSDRVLGLLDDYPTRSGYVITPVVVWGPREASLTANPKEVSEIYRVPLSDLDAPGVPETREIPESNREVICMPLLGHNIHAPTAALVFQLREVALWGRRTRVDHYDQPVFAWR